MQGRLPGVVAALGLVLAPGCRPAPLEGIGRATMTPQVSASRTATDDAGVAPSPLPPDYAARFARVGPESFVSYGHTGGRFTATVSVTPEARDALLAARAPLPAGTDVVMTTVDRTTRRPGPTLYMHRDPPPADRPSGAWRFGAVEGHGLTPEEAALCARCHAEAQHDGIFGLPEP